MLGITLDNRNCHAFKQELLDILHTCNPKPTALFRIAIEETEAWMLGDSNAIKAAFPQQFSVSPFLGVLG